MDGWSNAGGVTNLRTKNGTGIIRNFSGASLQCGSGCFVFDTEIPKEAHLLSLLLTAQVGGRSVKLWQVGCEKGGGGMAINGARIG